MTSLTLIILSLTMAMWRKRFCQSMVGTKISVWIIPYAESMNLARLRLSIPPEAFLLQDTTIQRVAVLH